MRLVVSAFLAVLVVISVYYGYLKLPIIKALNQCYAAAIQAVDDKHIMARRSYVSDVDICIERKRELLKAANCFVSLESEYRGPQSEMKLLSRLARYTSRSPQAQEEFVTRHNDECNFPETILRYDTVTGRWY